MTYGFAIDQSALAVLMACSPRERRLLADAFHRLAKTPFQESDMKDQVEGREIMVRFFGQFTLTYYADHAIKEVRIVNIFRD